MMHTANGRADVIGPPIQLGDFLPEKRQVILNGIGYEAWVTTNRRYPRRIQAQLDRYNARYQRIVAPLRVSRDSEDYDDAVFMEALENADEAYQSFVTDALMALVPRLSEADAELIPLEAAESILRELGYFAPVEQSRPVEPTAEDTGAVPLSSGTTSPEDSATSIQDTA